MHKIDRRHKYIIVLDTETANTFKEGNSLDCQSALVYDIGWCIMDTRGNVYEEYSYMVREIFIESPDLMQTAYYEHKREEYAKDVREGKRVVANWLTIRKAFDECCEKYNIQAIAAHNAYFDYKALQATTRLLTGSRIRYFAPYGIEWWDSVKMARSVILKMPTYQRFSETNGTLTKNGRLSASAENLYKFIINDPTFIESHTGLEDVHIEREIIKTCLRQHKKMVKKLWKD